MSRAYVCGLRFETELEILDAQAAQCGSGGLFLDTMSVDGLGGSRGRALKTMR